MALFIIIGIIVLVIAYVFLKPYFIKYDTTLLFTGTLGGGKTLNAVKTGIKIYNKTLLSIKWHNLCTRRFNSIRKLHNKKVNKRIEKNKKHTGKKWNLVEEQPLPKFISNIPVKLKGGKHEQWSNVLTKDMLILTKDEKGNLISKIPEYSVVLIDEIPQLVDQYNWNLKEVQENLNEMITFYRHYTAGKLIMTSQSDSQVVKQIRDKMNTFYWLSNFRKFLHFFYKCDVCQFISSDVVGNVNTGFIEDNTKTIYGTLFTKKYDSRCFSERYTIYPETNLKRWAKFKTNKIIRFDNYNSPLDSKPKGAK